MTGTLNRWFSDAPDARSSCYARAGHLGIRAGPDLDRDLAPMDPLPEPPPETVDLGHGGGPNHTNQSPTTKAMSVWHCAPRQSDRHVGEDGMTTANNQMKGGISAAAMSSVRRLNWFRRGVWACMDPRGSHYAVCPACKHVQDTAPEVGRVCKGRPVVRTHAAGRRRRSGGSD